RRLEPVELFRQVLNGVEELGDIHIEGDDGAARQGLAQEDLVFQIPHAAQIEQAEDAADVEHIHQRTEYAKDENLFLLGPTQLQAAAAEILHLGLLPVEHLGDLDARE